jgi:hypothetical protein
MNQQQKRARSRKRKENENKKCSSNKDSWTEDGREKKFKKHWNMPRRRHELRSGAGRYMFHVLAGNSVEFLI